MQRVAEGRGLPLESVARLAKGRAWTGEQALHLGLIDSLGGLAEAVALAKQRAGLTEEEGAVAVVQSVPQYSTALQQVLRLLRWGSQGGSEDSSSYAGAGSSTAATAWAAAIVGLPLPASEVRLLQQVLQGSGGGGILCHSLEAERLAYAASVA